MYFNAAPPASILASKYIWILFLRVSFQNLEHAFAEILANESDFPHLELIVADVFRKTCLVTQFSNCSISDLQVKSKIIVKFITFAVITYKKKYYDKIEQKYRFTLFNSIICGHM